MESEEIKMVTDFWVIGINYRKSDTALRGKYTISEHQYEAILQAAGAFGVSGLFVLSTCNRTELYGFSTNVHNMICLLCSQTEGDIAGFVAQAYLKNGNDALHHIFHVAAGLDSQILGDYEIVGQIKQAFYFAKNRGYTSSFLDRLYNTVLQSSRAIRSETQLSSGTVSIAFAAVQLLRDRGALDKARILVIGAGEIGRNTCRNLLDIVAYSKVTLVNRTREKAKDFAQELGIYLGSFEALPVYIRESDVIIVATAASQPLLTHSYFQEDDQKILIDLSVPNNIDPAVQSYKGITLVNIDELSLINDKTLRKREAEIPAAKALINCYIHEFAEWYMMRQHVPVLKEVKEKLRALNRQLSEARKEEDKNAVQKAINKMAKKMRTEEQRMGCNYIETMHHYLTEKAV